MRLLTYGEIIERGTSRFTVAAQIGGEEVQLKMSGAVRVDNPYKYLSDFVAELKVRLREERAGSAVLDFTDLTYCNSVGFYVLMDIIEAVYESVPGTVTIKRLKDDDWQQESLPILLDLDNEAVGRRTIVQEIPSF